MSPRPPLSTLFPYTTLFRSLVVAAMLDAAPSAEPLHIQVAKAWAAEHKHAPDLIRRTLVLLADHELNASTFTVRCAASTGRSEEHTSEPQSRLHLVCRLLLE